LDFDKLLAADYIDAVSANTLLDDPAVEGVAFFELAVEGGFHTRRSGFSLTLASYCQAKA
jgi:hypothetical protein